MQLTVFPLPSFRSSTVRMSAPQLDIKWENEHFHLENKIKNTNKRKAECVEEAL